MVVRGKMLTTLAGLMAGLGMLNAPLPGWTQQPAGGDAPRAERFGGQQDPFSAVESMQQEIKRMQRDLERARADLDKRMRDLQRRQQSFNDLVGRPKEEPRNRAGQIAQAPVAVPPTPTAQGAGMVAKSDVTVRQGAPVNDFDRRLRDVERKLDMLIQLMRQNQRSGTRSGAKTPPSVAPGADNLPPTPSVAPGGAISPTIPEAPARPEFPGRRSSETGPAAPEARIVGF
jgi:hypothetical protein